MSPLPQIHPASPSALARTTVPGQASTEPGAGSTKSIFAEVMRAVFDPASAPHPSPHLAQTGTRSSPAKSSSSTKADPSGSIVAAVSRQATSGRGNVLAHAAGNKGDETQGMTSTSMMGASLERGSAGPVKTEGRSQTSGQAADKTGPTSALSPKNDPGRSAPTNFLSVGIAQKVSTENIAISPSATTAAAVSVPTMARGAVPIVSESNSTASANGSKSTGTDGTPRSVSASNSASYPVAQTSSLPVTGAGGDKMLSTANLVDPKVGKVSPEASPVGSGRDTPVNAGPAPSQRKDEKQMTPASAGNSPKAANLDTQTGNQDSSAASRSAASSTAADGATANTTGDYVNAVGNGSSSIAGSASGASTSPANNGNAASGSSPSSTTAANLDPAVLRTGNSSPTAVSSPAAGQNVSGAHAPPLPPVEASNASLASAASAVHGGPNFISLPGTAGSGGTSGLAHAPSVSNRIATPDAFTALDSSGSAEHGVLLHAAPHQVAVGVVDPSLGWVEVRAERIAGQVTAALTADSAASHAALTSAMPSMATYLQDHHTGVQHIQVETGLAGGQAGTGSQGHASSQGDAPNAGSNAGNSTDGGLGWGSAATAEEQVPHTMPALRSAIEDHRVSVRA